MPERCRTCRVRAASAKQGRHRAQGGLVVVDEMPEPLRLLIGQHPRLLDTGDCGVGILDRPRGSLLETLHPAEEAVDLIDLLLGSAQQQLEPVEQRLGLPS